MNNYIIDNTIDLGINKPTNLTENFLENLSVSIKETIEFFKQNKMPAITAIDGDLLSDDYFENYINDIDGQLYDYINNILLNEITSHINNNFINDILNKYTNLIDFEVKINYSNINELYCNIIIPIESEIELLKQTQSSSLKELDTKLTNTLNDNIENIINENLDIVSNQLSNKEIKQSHILDNILQNSILEDLQNKELLNYFNNKLLEEVKPINKKDYIINKPVNIITTIIKE